MLRTNGDENSKHFSKLCKIVRNFFDKKSSKISLLNRVQNDLEIFLGEDKYFAIKRVVVKVIGGDIQFFVIIRIWSMRHIR